MLIKVAIRPLYISYNCILENARQRSVDEDMEKRGPSHPADTGGVPIQRNGFGTGWQVLKMLELPDHRMIPLLKIQEK